MPLPSMTAAALLPASLATVSWLSRYFELDHGVQPDGRIVGNPIEGIYDEYQHDPSINDYLSYAAFAALIRNVFPAVSFREYRSVDGNQSNYHNPSYSPL